MWFSARSWTLIVAVAAAACAAPSPAVSSDAGGPCGAVAESCCDGTACNNGLTCLASICQLQADDAGGAPDAGPCGAMAEPCCNEAACDNGLMCVSGVCEQPLPPASDAGGRCGAVSEPCCDGAACDNGLLCVAALCAAPPPVDAGPAPDGGPDADGGAGPDAGQDAGESVDAGPTGTDAGPEDAGDSGPDAGPADAGSQPIDAGPVDAGPGDAGPGDAGPADAGWIEISSVMTNATAFSAASGHNAIVVTFDTPASLDTAPASLSVTLESVAFNCQPYAAGSPNYSCSYTVTGTEIAGAQPIEIAAVDAHGASGTASALITLDFTPPALSSGPSVTYSPETSNYLATVSAAAVGTSAIVSFTSSVPLGAAPIVTAAPSGLTFTPVSANDSAYVFSTQAVAAGSPPDGAYALSIVLQDQLGNVATLQPATPAVVVLTATPAAPATSAGGPIVYTRIPWGSSATSGVAKFTVVGTAGATAPGTHLTAFDGPNPQTNFQLGQVTTDATGAFALALSGGDRYAIYLAAVDAAGNISPTAVTHNVTWISSFGGKLPGNTMTNPNVLETVTDFQLTNAPPLLEGAQEPPNEVEANIYNGVVLPSDSEAFDVTTSPTVWRNVTPSATATFVGPIIYDAALQTTFMYLGTYNQMWDWNGALWTEGTDPSPPGDCAGLAYDATHQVVVLFGGTVSSALSNQTWEYNGTSWTNPMPATSPPVRSGTALAFDSTRGRLVLFGGYESSTDLNDTWEWDGSNWTNVTPATSPDPRSGPAMAYDSVHEKTVLFGGYGLVSPSTYAVLNDTWEWDGSTWVQLNPASSPPVRYNAGLVFDASRGKAVLFGGSYESQGFTETRNDTWEWNGATWTETVVAGPPSSDYFTYDSGHAESVLQTGYTTWVYLADPLTRAGAVAQFAALPTGIFTPTYEQVTFTASLGGAGNTVVASGSGTAVPGATLAVWDTSAAAWRSLATNTSPVASPTLISYTTTSPAEEANYLVASPATIDLGLFPTASNGSGGTSSIAVDYVEVEVQYQQ